MTVGARSMTIGAPGVLSNDSGGRAPLQARLNKQPKRGSVTLQPDGSFTFKLKSGSNPGAGKTDSFAYKVTDGFTTSSSVNVTIVWVK
jgi:VCBS repeat-containing protein